jgi:LmbE family N-acetylglucosaminyl deacetylase
MYAMTVAGNIVPGSPSPPHRVAQVFFMAPVIATFAMSYLSARETVFCDYYVDITDTAELKVRALDAMRSQQYAGNYARKTIETWQGRPLHGSRLRRGVRAEHA